MRSRWVCMLLALLTSILFTACSGGFSGADPTGSADTEGSPTAAATGTPEGSPQITPTGGEYTVSAGDTALEAFRAVLTNNAVFYSVEHNRNFLMKEFLNKALGYPVFMANCFAIVDMDADEVPEMILEHVIDEKGYDLFRYKNGPVYRFDINYRIDFQKLKKDGTFAYRKYWSKYRKETGYGTLKLLTTSYVIVPLGNQKTGLDKHGIITTSYFVNDEPVDEETYRAFSEDQDSKENTVWYPYSDRSIEAAFSALS